MRIYPIVLYILLFTSPAFSQTMLEFDAVLDEDGNVVLQPKEELHRMLPDAPLREHEGGAESLKSYILTDELGDQALIYVPAGQAPTKWANEDEIFGIEPANTQYNFSGSSALQRAQELLQTIMEAAVAQFCGAPVHPSEIVVSVSAGASLFVQADASVQATFLYTDLCIDD